MSLFGYKDAAVTIYGGTDYPCTRDYGENWRLSLCAPGLFDAGNPAQPHNRCPLPVMQILASYGFKTGQIPKDIARYCADPCTQILWDGLTEQANSGDKGRAAKLRAIREVRAERQAASKLRM